MNNPNLQYSHLESQRVQTIECPSITNHNYKLQSLRYKQKSSMDMNQAISIVRILRLNILIIAYFNNKIQIKMVYPLNNNTDPYQSYTYYQGIIVSELVCTVSLFIFLQALHYCLWGHDEEAWEWKKNEEGEAGLQPLPPSEWKWDQKGWNMYFAIIFGNHICSVFLPMTYLPNIITCVISYSHFTCFCGLLINQIFITEKEAGKGGKTTTNRIFWVLMSLFNLALIVAGLVGIPQVIQ